MTILILAKSGASTNTSYIAPQPPLTSTTAMSVAEGKAEARAVIRLSSAADLVWKLIGLLWKYLGWDMIGGEQRELLEQTERGPTVCERDSLIILDNNIAAAALQIF